MVAKKKTKSFASLRQIDEDIKERVLIDRHGEDCGVLLYSPYFENDMILALNEKAPRNITLATWQRWGKQAAAYRRSLKALLKPVAKKKKKAKKKVTTAKKKKGK